MKRKITGIIVVMFLIISMITYSYAATQSSLNDQKNDLTQQKKETEDDLKEVKEDISENIEKIQSLDLSINETEDDIQRLNQEIKNLEKDIVVKEEEIKQKEEEYQESDKLLRERLVTMYEAGETSYLDVLFSSEGLMDFISKYYWLTELAECDMELMEKIEQERIEIENQKAQVEKNKQQVEDNKKSVQTKQTELKVQKAKRQTEAAALSKEEKELQAEIDKVTKEIQQVEEEILRIAEQAGNQGGGSGHVYTGGKLAWPCPNYSRISSYFGSRGSPLTGGSSYHKGIDIAASKGNSIVAAEAGTVIKVVNGCSHNYGKSRSCGCGGGYGNYVMVNHGGGLVTIYAHCSTINVSNGQSVSKGQTIATVGSTGASTGNHLHFGVAQNGVYRDPMGYVK